MDPYVYPGTNVLKNLRGIQNLDVLSEFGMQMTTRRLIELSAQPMRGSFDAAHARAIHKHIFQDVYPWAGDFRTVNISRSGQHPFAFAEQIPSSMDRLARGLEKERLLDGLDQTQRKVCPKGACLPAPSVSPGLQIYSPELTHGATR
jgi:cell filamentation protein